jgi:hypothetical protein
LELLQKENKYKKGLRQEVPFCTFTITASLNISNGKKFCKYFNSSPGHTEKVFVNILILVREIHIRAFLN